MYKEERDVFEEMRKIDECGMGKFGADSEKDTRRRSISVSSKHMTENDPLH